MVIRIAVVDANSAAGLMPLLADEVEVERICFEPSMQQVYVDVQTSPDQTLVKVLNVVEEWLGAGGRAPTRIEVDDHSYVLGAQANGAVA